MTPLTRITTEYVLVEDRIRLSGERSGGAPVAVWLTLRLLQRLLPLLLQWLERDGGGGEGEATALTTAPASLRAGFAQAEARAAIPRQAPVVVRGDAEAWVAHAVDFASATDVVRLTFKSGDGHSAVLGFNARQLRQWLSILHDQWGKAEWPAGVWPAWVSAVTVERPQAALLH